MKYEDKIILNEKINKLNHYVYLEMWDLAYTEIIQLTFVLETCRK